MHKKKHSVPSIHDISDDSDDDGSYFVISSGYGQRGNSPSGRKISSLRNYGIGNGSAKKKKKKRVDINSVNYHARNIAVALTRKTQIEFAKSQGQKEIAFGKVQGKQLDAKTAKVIQMKQTRKPMSRKELVALVEKDIGSAPAPASAGGDALADADADAGADADADADAAEDQGEEGGDEEAATTARTARTDLGSVDLDKLSDSDVDLSD